MAKEKSVAESRDLLDDQQISSTAESKVEKVETSSEKRAKKPMVAKEIDPHQYITVYNGFHGPLVYKSKKTGERFTWDEFGDVQEMELVELRNAKSSSKGFFVNNWFMFDEPWVVEYLGLNQYYKHALRIDEFDELFEMEIPKMQSVIAELSAGQKATISYRAREMVKTGDIDSNRMIAALEESLGVELIER